MDEKKPTWHQRIGAFRERIPRSATSDVCDVSGLGCLVGAAFWWAPIAGLVALGMALIFAGWVTSD